MVRAAKARIVSTYRRGDASDSSTAAKRRHAPLGEGQFRILFEAAPNGLMAVDADGRIVVLNAQIEKIFGWSREELIGRPVEELIPQRLRPGHGVLRMCFAAAPKARPMGAGRFLAGLRKDGSEFPVEIGLNPIATARGNIVIASVVDITEQKRAEEPKILLERARAKMEVCQQLGMPAAVLQRDGHVLLLNALLKKLHSQFVLTGDRIKLSDEIANAHLTHALARLDALDPDRIGRSIPVLAAEGHPPLIFHLLPMKGSFGNVLGILVVTTVAELGVPAEDLVQGLFALAPAEARVAALIGSGLSPRQAAEQLGISEGTVRTTLKHVFGKTGVSRQSELAVLLTKLALR